MIIIILLVIGLLLYYPVLGDNNKSISKLIKKNPEYILKERYINGEIDEEKYLKMIEIIK
jgi:uncharacterized membrane protein